MAETFVLQRPDLPREMTPSSPSPFVDLTAGSPGFEHSGPSAALTPEIQLSIKDFYNFLQNAVPVLLVHPDLREYIIREANYRLGEARREGIPLKDISIGGDCLPVWPGLYWDPDVESLHSVLQSRLMDYQASRDLGNVLRMDIIVKGNNKLDEARRLGLSLKDIEIGDRLLPVWNLPTDSIHTTGTLTTYADSSLGKDVASHAGADHGGDSRNQDVENSFTASGLPEEYESSSSSRDTQASSYLATVFDTSDATDANDWTSDLGFDDSDSSSEPETIVLNNHVWPSPEYVDPADPEEPHILHGAQLVNAGSHNVGGDNEDIMDIEVYVVEDEDEDTLQDMPSVELAIDSDTFEWHYDTSEAVEIEIPGVAVRCGSPSSASSASDSHESDDEPEAYCGGTGDFEFQETEYGFKW